MVKTSYRILGSGGAFMMGMFLVISPLLKAAWQQDTIDAMERKLLLKKVASMMKAKAAEEGTDPLLSDCFDCLLFIICSRITGVLLYFLAFPTQAPRGRLPRNRRVAMSPRPTVCFNLLLNIYSVCTVFIAWIAWIGSCFIICSQVTGIFPFYLYTGTEGKASQAPQGANVAQADGRFPCIAQQIFSKYV
jgi:hypothetical protein